MKQVAGWKTDVIKGSIMLPESLLQIPLVTCICVSRGCIAVSRYLRKRNGRALSLIEPWVIDLTSTSEEYIYRHI